MYSSKRCGGSTRRLYPDVKPKTLLNWASQVWPFAHEIKKADLVIVPLKTQPAIQIGEVMGKSASSTARTPSIISARVLSSLREISTISKRCALSSTALGTTGFPNPTHYFGKGACWHGLGIVAEVTATCHTKDPCTRPGMYQLFACPTPAPCE
jgi:hypothetical protein